MTEEKKVEKEAVKETIRGLTKDEAKEAFKEAIREWLNEKLLEFGTFSAKGIAAALLGGVLSLIMYIQFHGK